MNINLELLDLRAFLAVFDLRSFRAAADAVVLSQPALSRRIQALEENLGAALFERSTRHVAPTQLGRTIEPVVRRLLDEFQTSILDIGGLGRRQGAQVTLACVPTAAFYFLPQVIQRFSATYPGIRFRILDLSANDGLESVARGQAEFGINFVGSAEDELTFTPLREDFFVLACRKDHRFAAYEALTWSDLEGERLIGVSRSSGNRMLLDAALAKQSVRLTWHFEVNHLTTSLGLVEAGLGVSVLPRLATPQGEHPILIVRPIKGPEISRTIGIVERRATRLSPAAQHFRDMLVESWQDNQTG